MEHASSTHKHLTCEAQAALKRERIGSRPETQIQNALAEHRRVDASFEELRFASLCIKREQRSSYGIVSTRLFHDTDVFVR